ncbi:MAG: helix-turn-helix domain-containing protein [Gammaproteobacteria bacterium]|jgi:AraC-like DNA-binding protein|nr:helix-turn-helix domain-containing protein [Gammaproteobacteria bacterium]
MSYRPGIAFRLILMDILNDVLKTLRLSSKVFLHAKFCEHWVIDIEPLNLQVSFHVIAHGDCWLHTKKAPTPTALHAGDLVICLRNTPHYVTNSPELPPDDLPRNSPTTEETPGPSTSLICGQCEFLQYYWNPMLEAMPNIMVIPTADSAGSNLASVIKLMIAEVESAGECTNAIIDRLSDILFIEAIRKYIQLQNNNQGYIAALKDSRLSKALTSFHKQPENTWTVQTLSEEAGMSRSAFADKFKQMVDMSPMEYVTGWRMQHAYDELTSNGKSVTQITEDSSYQSEAAFRKAFKKQFGVGPGMVRRVAKEQLVSAN